MLSLFTKSVLLSKKWSIRICLPEMIYLCSLPALFLLLSINTACASRVVSENSLVQRQNIWDRSDIYESEISYFKSSYKTNTSFPLTVIRNKDSKWTQKKIAEMIKTSEELLFRECGISISPITFIELKHDSLNLLDCKNDYIFTRDLPQGIDRPIAVFTQKHGCSAMGFSNPEPAIEHEFPHLSYGTSFIMHGVLTKPNTSQTVVDVIVAHELLHLFLYSNKEQNLSKDPGNTMNHDLKQIGYSLTSEQCSTVRKHRFLNVK